MTPRALVVDTRLFRTEIMGIKKVTLVMSVFFDKVSVEHKLPRHWDPHLCQELTDLHIIDASGTEHGALFLSKDGRVYRRGQSGPLDPASGPETELITELPDGIRAVAVKAVQNDEFLSEIFVLMEDGSLYRMVSMVSKHVSTNGILLPGVTQILPPGPVDMFAVGETSVMVLRDGNLIKLKPDKEAKLSDSPFLFKFKQTKSIDLMGRRVVSLAGFNSHHLILLDDGILYTTAKSSSMARPASFSSELRICTPFLGKKMIYFHADGEDVVAVYCDGTMALCKFEEDGDHNRVKIGVLPVFPTEVSGCVTQVQLTNDLVWFLTESGEVFYIAKNYLSTEDPRTIAKYRRVPSSVLSKVSHLAGTEEKIWFFTDDRQHEPIATPISEELLCGKKDPFKVRMGNQDLVFVDPCGARKIGFNAGDHVIGPDAKPYLILGTCNDLLYVQDLSEGLIESLPLPTVEQGLFQWKLCHRRNSELKVVTIDGHAVQIDCSASALGHISFFESGDVIHHEKFGEGVVLGERCECLWVKYNDKCRACRSKDRTLLHLEHKFVARRGASVVCKNDMHGVSVPISEVPLGFIEPGCVVQSREYGIGVYHGTAVGHSAVSFVKDCGFCRLIPIDPQGLVLKRSLKKQNVCFTCLDYSTQHVNVSQDSCLEYGLMPCDYIEIGSDIALCVGLGSLKEGPVVLFETETMIKHGTGVGAFNVGKLERPFTILARIASPCKVKQKLADGSEIELSVDTDDFTGSQFLPGDVLLVGERQIRVQGIADKQLFVKEKGSDVCEPLQGGNHRLLYRIIGVPTTCKTSTATGFIDLESLRGCGVIPGDLADKEGEKAVVIAGVDESHVIVAGSPVPEVLTVAV